MPKTIEYLSKRNRFLGAPGVNFGDVTYGAGGRFGPRAQQDFQVVIIHEGEATVRVDGVEHHVPAQRAILSKPGTTDEYEFCRATSTRHTWCAMAVRLVPPPLAEALLGLPFQVPLTTRMQSLIDLGLSSPRPDAPEATAIINLLGEAVLREYLCSVRFEGTGPAPLPMAVVRAREYVSRNFARPLTVAEVAAAACCSANHLTQLFHKHVRMTPARYLWQTRVRNGVDLLRQTGLSVAQIADRTGFQNPFHFSRLVKQLHGVGPRALRARLWLVDR